MEISIEEYNKKMDKIIKKKKPVHETLIEMVNEINKNKHDKTSK